MAAEDNILLNDSTYNQSIVIFCNAVCNYPMMTLSGIIWLTLVGGTLQYHNIF